MPQGAQIKEMKIFRELRKFLKLSQIHTNNSAASTTTEVRGDWTPVAAAPGREAVACVGK